MGNTLATNYETDEKKQLIQSITSNDLFTFTFHFSKDPSRSEEENSWIACKALRSNSLQILKWMCDETDIVTDLVKNDLVDEMCDRPYREKDKDINTLVMDLVGQNDGIDDWKQRVVMVTSDDNDDKSGDEVAVTATDADIKKDDVKRSDWDKLSAEEDEEIQSSE